MSARGTWLARTARSLVQGRAHSRKILSLSDELNIMHIVQGMSTHSRMLRREMLSYACKYPTSHISVAYNDIVKQTVTRDSASSVLGDSDMVVMITGRADSQSKS